MFRVVQHGEKLHLRFQLVYKDKLSVHGSILETVQNPGSLQVPDSSAKHRRDNEVTMNSKEAGTLSNKPFFSPSAPLYCTAIS